MKYRKNKYILSICIPTYNHSDYLEILLHSIFEQNVKDTEILVSDNASTDNTEIVVEAFGKLFDNIRYIKNTTNIGFDKNISQLIQQATGDYCYFIGADDVMLANSIEQLKKAISSNDPLYLVNRITFRGDFESDQLKSEISHFDYNNHLKNIQLSTVLNFKTSIYYFFSYLGSILIKRDCAATFDRSTPPGSFYQHALIATKTFELAGYYIEIVNPLVLCRVGNDTFAATHGRFKRMEIDYRFIVLISSSNFKKTPDLFFYLMRIFHKEQGLLRLYAITFTGFLKKPYTSLAILKSIFITHFFFFKKFLLNNIKFK